MKKNVALIIFSFIWLTVPFRVVNAADEIDGKIIALSPRVLGDSVLIESKGKYLLMDTGYGVDNTTTGTQDYVRQYLIKNTNKTVSLYLSHYHYDHYGMMERILRKAKSVNSTESADLTIEKIYLPKSEYITKHFVSNTDGVNIMEYDDASGSLRKAYEFYNRIVAQANEKGIPIEEVEAGSSINIGDAKVSVIGPLHPLQIVEEQTDGSNKYLVCRYTGDDNHTFLIDGISHYINNGSLVSKVYIGNVSYLTAGDSEKEIEEDLINHNVNLKSDIFKLSHHSNITSNTDNFLKKVNPTYSFSTFYYNPKKNNNIYTFDGCFTSDSTISSVTERVRKITNLYSTTYNGVITYTIRGNNIDVDTELNSHKIQVNYVDDKGKTVNKNSISFNTGLEYTLHTK